MTEEVNVGMGAPAPKKGMSTGCLVAIIVSTVLVILVAMVIIFAIKYKSDVVSYGTSMTLNSTKIMLAEDSLSGVDTVYYNKLIDDFNTHLYADTITLDEVSDSVRFVEISNIFTLAQSVVADKKIDSAEVTILIEALITKYPDIVPNEFETEIIDSLQTGY